MFVRKGYCRFCGSKCRHFKVKETKGICKRKPWAEMRSKKTGKLKSISSDKNVNVKAPKWCPKL